MVLALIPTLRLSQLLSCEHVSCTALPAAIMTCFKDRYFCRFCWSCLWSCPCAAYEGESRQWPQLTLIACVKTLSFQRCHSCSAEHPYTILCRMRNLELASTAGIAVLLAFFAIIVYRSIATGFPAIADGELPLWKLEVCHSTLSLLAIFF